MNDTTTSGHQTLSRYHVRHHDPESAKWALVQEEKALRRHHEKVNRLHSYFYAAGRILIALLFVNSAIAKELRFAETQRTMSYFGLTNMSLLLVTAILIELIGGILVGIGYKLRWAAAGLIAYLVAVTIFVPSDFTVVLNLAFAGGLLMLVAHGPGTFSLDKLLKQRNALRERVS